MTARPGLRHILAVAAGLVVCMLAFFYTGDSDLIFALTSGLGAAGLVYLAAWLPKPPARAQSKRRPF